MKCRTGHFDRGTIGFTLIELLVVIAIISLLVSILMPSLVKAKQLAKKSVCAVHVRGMHLGTSLYLQESGGVFFPMSTSVSAGTLWYFGLEITGSGSGEGNRVIDASKSCLAPYITELEKTTNCPSFPLDESYFKPKFTSQAYGYAINRRMLSDSANNPDGRWDKLTHPGETVMWADSVQINTFQAPASPSNPMIEEWYYLDNRKGASPTFHFRHLRECNTAFADGSVRPLSPVTLDSRCDGLVGRPEPAVWPNEISPLLQLIKK